MSKYSSFNEMRSLSERVKLYEFHPATYIRHISFYKQEKFFKDYCIHFLLLFSLLEMSSEPLEVVMKKFENLNFTVAMKNQKNIHIPFIQTYSYTTNLYHELWDI